ncbi:ParA family protein [Viridibacillus arvi]|uniref:ParA family protein n=1 Tax=Viridibacillus arvi TaxID=263475 RepID=UPI003D08D7B7
MAVKITFGNFKGGVGKTTISCIVAYILAERGFKVLHINFDLQTNGTKLLAGSFPSTDSNYETVADYIKEEGATTIYQAMEERDLQKAILPLTDKLDIIPSSIDLSMLNDLVTKSNEKVFLKTLLDEVEDDYDFIIFDPKPSIDLHTTNTIMASDYVVGVLKTEIDSYEGLSYFYLDYIEGLNKEKLAKYNQAVKLIGVVVYQFDKSDTMDNLILEVSREDEAIAKYLFDTIIHHRKRVKGFRGRGISRVDQHDKQALQMFDSLVDELLERIMEDINGEG